MTKTVYIHIGLHKTGSTSIQWGMTLGRATLQESGVLYSEIGIPPIAPFGHHLLAWAAVRRAGYVPVFRGQQVQFNQEARDILWQRLTDEIQRSAAHSIVLSSEEFDVLIAEEIAEIGDRLRTFNVVPILFLRNTADLMESSYKTAVLYSSYADTIDKFVGNQRSRTDYAQMMRDWLKISSSGRMVVHNYDKEEIRRDSLGAFLQILDVDLNRMPKECLHRQNDSFPSYAVELARFLRLKGVQESEVQTWLNRIKTIPEVRNAEPASFLDEATIDALDKKYQSEMDLVNSDIQLKCVLGATLEYAPAHRGHRRPMRHVVDAILELGRCVSQ